MKKLFHSPLTIFITILCCAAFVFSTSERVAASGGSTEPAPEEPTPSIPAHCVAATAGYDYEPVGCPCDIRTGSQLYYPLRDSQEKGERFCDDPNVMSSHFGTVRECIDDASHKCPSSITDKRADFYSCECNHGAFQYFPPFCVENKCNNCRTDDDCRYPGLGALQPYTQDEVLNQKCLLPIYAAPKRKMCHYCKPLGRPQGGKVFTIAVIPSQNPGNKTSLDVANIVVGWLRNAQPFGWLYNQGKIRFQFVDVPTQHVLFPLTWESEEIDGQQIPVRISPSQESEISTFASTVCGQSDYLLVIVRDWSGQLIDGYQRTLDAPAYSVFKETTVVHETGHLVGKLGEEYYMGANRRAQMTQVMGHYTGPSFENIDTQQAGECPKFQRFGLAKHLCYPIFSSPLTSPTAFEKDFRTSTPNSVMANTSSSNNYNVVSCGAIIGNVTGVSTKEGVATCLREPSIWSDLVLGPPN